MICCHRFLLHKPELSQAEDALALQIREDLYCGGKFGSFRHLGGRSLHSPIGNGHSEIFLKVLKTIFFNLLPATGNWILQELII